MKEDKKNDPLIWVMDKKIKYWYDALYFLSLGLSPFYTTYIWYIIFVSIWGIMFFRERTLRSYKYPETLMAITGLVTGIVILGIFDYFDILSSQLVFDKHSHKLFYSSTEPGYIGDKHQILIKDDVGLIKESDKLTSEYGYSQTYINKLNKENKIKTIPLIEWIRKHDYAYNSGVGIGGSGLQSFIGKHVVFTTILLLTMAFIIAVWNKKIFKKVFTWIAVTLTLELLIGGIWWNDRSFVESANLLFYLKKGQIIVSSLSITTMLIFMGLAYKK